MTSQLVPMRTGTTKPRCPALVALRSMAPSRSWCPVRGLASSCIVLTISMMAQSPCQRAMPEFYEPVDFSIMPLSPTTGARRWVATYGAGPQQVQFEIRVDRPGLVRGASPLAGYLLPHSPPGDPTEFLNRLVQAHRARPGGVTVSAYESLPFRAEVLGVDLSRTNAAGMIAGSFNDAPRGTWTVLHLYIDLLSAEGVRGPFAPQPAEIFLALSPATGDGALIPVDSRWAPLIFAAFLGLIRPPPPE